MTPEEFIAAIAPAARASMAKTGIRASFVIAQGALESSWGTSQLARDGRNLFGVKADSAWRGPVLQLPTKEYLAGKWVTVPAFWRSYPDWLACIDDHAAFFQRNPRYKAALAVRSDPEAFARAIAAAGYATDPQYVDKVLATMRARKLTQFDT